MNVTLIEYGKVVGVIPFIITGVEFLLFLFFFFCIAPHRRFCHAIGNDRCLVFMPIPAIETRCTGLETV